MQTASGKLLTGQQRKLFVLERFQVSAVCLLKSQLCLLGYLKYISKAHSEQGLPHPLGTDSDICPGLSVQILLGNSPEFPHKLVLHIHP